MLTEKSEVMRFEDLETEGVAAARTLRNRLNVKSGLIEFGGHTPDLCTVLIGGRRVVLRRVFEAWLNQIAAGKQQAEPEPEKRGRGRPRKCSTTAGAK